MGTKIRLSAEEKRMVGSERFILTKNRILQKMMHLMGELKQAYDPLLTEISLPEGTASAKISRGENYKGLPWMMLDHPRYFSGKETLAIRSFFWWGHYFSISLQLSGLPKEKATPRILENFKVLRKANYYLCVPKNRQRQSGAHKIRRGWRQRPADNPDEPASRPRSGTFLPFFRG